MTTVNLTSNSAPKPRRSEPGSPTRPSSMESAPFAPSPVFERLQRGGSGGMPLTWLAVPAGVLIAGALIYMGMNSGGSHTNAVASVQPAQPTTSVPAPAAPSPMPVTTSTPAPSAPSPVAVRRTAQVSSVHSVSSAHRAVATPIARTPTSPNPAAMPRVVAPPAGQSAPMPIVPPAAQSTPAQVTPSASPSAAPAPADQSAPAPVAPSADSSAPASAQ